MAIERASVRALPKPWGVEHLHPWNDAAHSGHAIGEVWYERPGNAQNSSLLLKLLFTEFSHFPSRSIRTTRLHIRWVCQTVKPKLGTF